MPNTREKLIELMREGRYKADNICNGNDDCQSCTIADPEGNCKAKFVADHLIANGVTIQRWIPVTERLPEDGEYVFVWCRGECQVARIEKGISEEERMAMRRGELPDPEIMGWTLSDGWRAGKRSRCYYGCDVQGNNKVPYMWKANGGPMEWFGQDVTHWMHLPEAPKGE